LFYPYIQYPLSIIASWTKEALSVEKLVEFRLIWAALLIFWLYGWSFKKKHELVPGLVTSDRRSESLDSLADGKNL